MKPNLTDRQLNELYEGIDQLAQQYASQIANDLIITENTNLVGSIQLFDYFQAIASHCRTPEYREGFQQKIPEYLLSQIRINGLDAHFESETAQLKQFLTTYHEIYKAAQSSIVKQLEDTGCNISRTVFGQAIMNKGPEWKSIYEKNRWEDIQVFAAENYNMANLYEPQTLRDIPSIHVKLMML